MTEEVVTQFGIVNAGPSPLPYFCLTLPKFNMNSPWNVTETQKERIVFQPSWLSGASC